MREDLMVRLEHEDNVILKLNFWSGRKEELVRELDEVVLRAREAKEQVLMGNVEEAKQFFYDGGLF